MPRRSAKSQSVADRIWPAFAVLIVASGLAGIDFGVHWDEFFTLTSVQRTFGTGNLLPIHYNYPSMLFWIGNLLAFPRFLVSGLDSQATVAFLKGQAFSLYFRGALFLLAQLAAVWAYGIGRAASLPRWGAILAGLLVSLSYEFHYHSRWIAPDALASQWVLLSFYLLLLSETSRKQAPKFLIGAAAAVGLAAGTKYTLALFLLPVLGSAWLGSKPWRERAKQLVLLGAVFALVYLITTPGTLLDHQAIFESWRTEHQHYSVKGHKGNTVASGLPHFGGILLYLSCFGLSAFPAVALALFVLSLIGAYRLTRQFRTLALAGGACLLYLIYFSGQVVLIVRNYLVVVPVLAVFSAAGCVSVYETWRGKRKTMYRTIGAGLLAGCLLLNLAWLVYAAGTILFRDRVDTGAEVQRRILSSAKQVCLTARARALLSPGQAAEIERYVSPRLEECEEVYFIYDDLGAFSTPANRPGRYRLLRTGPFEVNIDYYPSWNGPRRILIMDREEFPKDKWL